MTQLHANDFAAHWLASWNARDLAQILEHYAEDIEFSSPFAAGLTGDSLVVGKAALTNYFFLALGRFPDLHFSQMRAFPGHDSVVLVYRSVNGLEAAETMVFNSNERVRRVWAHYREAPEPGSIG